MPGHISVGSTTQFFCPASVCVEQSSQEAAWAGAAGPSRAGACLPELCPERTALREPSMRAQETLLL